uniref:Ig-like domain-containing protein n=1 Tax=Romanomermis culicivorax TaxID=13658 RepID=A0A915KLV0_ROMCU
MVNEFHPFKTSSMSLHVCLSHKTADSLAVEYFIDSIDGLNSPKNFRYESPKIAALKIYDRSSMSADYFYQKFNVEQKSMHSGLVIVTVKNTKSKYAGRYSFLVPYQFLNAKFDKNDIEIRQGQSCPAVGYLYCQFKRPYSSDFFVRIKWEHKNLTSLDASTNLVNEFGSTSILIAGDEGTYKCVAEIYSFHTNMKNATFYTVPYAFDLTNECTLVSHSYFFNFNVEVFRAGLTAKGAIVRYGLGSAYTAPGKKAADTIIGYLSLKLPQFSSIID